MTMVRTQRNVLAADEISEIDSVSRVYLQLKLIGYLSQHLKAMMVLNIHQILIPVTMIHKRDSVVLSLMKNWVYDVFGWDIPYGKSPGVYSGRTVDGINVLSMEANHEIIHHATVIGYDRIVKLGRHSLDKSSANICMYFVLYH